MKSAGNLLVLAFALLLAIPAVATPQGRWGTWGRVDNRDSVYRAGYNDGFRNGMRQGTYDFRSRRKFNYHTREYNLADRYYYGADGRYRKDYGKGYKKGYREGYENAYRGYNRNRRLPF